MFGCYKLCPSLVAVNLEKLSLLGIRRVSPFFHVRLCEQEHTHVFVCLIIRSNLELEHINGW